MTFLNIQVIGDGVGTDIEDGEIDGNGDLGGQKQQQQQQQQQQQRNRHLPRQRKQQRQKRQRQLNSRPQLHQIHVGSLYLMIDDLLV